jgi:hypothetical protein
MKKMGGGILLVNSYYSIIKYNFFYLNSPKTYYFNFFAIPIHSTNFLVLSLWRNIPRPPFLA